MNSVCGDAKLNHNHRTHAPVSTSENAANIVVLTKRYKQCPKKIDALTNSLDKYNTSVVDRQFNIDYGKFDGRITIMGSGGSHKLMGNFAPTTKMTKHDSLVQIGAGQNKVRAINIRLEKLAIDQSVQAVFLNEEHYYGQKPSTIQTPRTLRFLGYFVFFESRFTTGEEYSKIADEFNQPTANNFHHLTFRLHPHLRVEGKPFIPSLMELDQLTKGSDTNYKKIVLEHDDHSNIFFDCVGLDDWKTCHHKVTIEDVILQMIATGELNKHILTNSDNDKEDEIANVGVDVNDGFSSRIQIEEENLLGNGYEEAVATNDNESYYDKKDSDNDESDMVEDSSPSDSDYDDKRSDHNKLNMISADSLQTDEDSLCGGPSADENASMSDNSDDSEDKTDLPSDGNKKIGNKCIEPYRMQGNIGSAATIRDIVYCCIHTNAACSMRYNKRSLRDIKGYTCAGPLTEKSLGLTLRTRPTPSPNRAMDVSLCYLRRVLKSNPILRQSILDGTRCKSMLITNDILTDIMFQIIVFRYTGRIYRFELYRKQRDTSIDSESTTPINQPIPVRETLGIFLNHLKLNLNLSHRNQMSNWVSKQHDGAISHDCVRNCVLFCRFMKHIAHNLEFTIEVM
jgi:hypothetical protein